MLEAKRTLTQFDTVFDLVKDGRAKDIRWIVYCLNELDFGEIPASKFRDFINAVLACANRMFRSPNGGINREDVVLLDQIYKVYYSLMEYYHMAGYQ